MTVPTKRSLTYLAVVVTIALSVVFTTTIVNAAPTLQEETSVSETAALNDASSFGVLVLKGDVTGVFESYLDVTPMDGDPFVAQLDKYAVLFNVTTQSEASLSDIQDGDLVEVVGLKNADGDIAADFISIIPKGESLRGKISEVYGGTVVINHNGVDYVITSGDETVFYLDGQQTSLANLAVDMNLQAFGEYNSEGALDANLIITHKGATTAEPVAADVSDLGRQRDDSAEFSSAPAVPPGGYSTGRGRDIEIPAAAVATPEGGYSVDRQRDP